LSALFRLSRVGLVTPLRDGMNLVAKEFAAAQDPADPGVLVLSKFAGSAESLDGPLLVSPYDTGEVAEAMAQALAMPLQERTARWQTLMQDLSRHDIHHWQKTFLEALQWQKAGATVG
jgi:trehalose 6-phosphate synthase